MQTNHSSETACQADPRATSRWIQDASEHLEAGDPEYWTAVKGLQEQFPGILCAVYELSESYDPRNRSVAVDILGQSRRPQKAEVELCRKILGGMQKTETVPLVVRKLATALAGLELPKAG